jgi:hypothetical protein
MEGKLVLTAILILTKATYVYAYDGEAITEPTTLLLLGVGAVIWRRKVGGSNW